MNYRHAFHAGNFADLLKHAVLLGLLDTLTAAPDPLFVYDTHAGAGVYDLSDEPSRRSGEAARGVGRLMTEPALPALLESLRLAVAAANDGEELKHYPGSPLLISRLLRPRDSFWASETRPDDCAALRRSLKDASHARVTPLDGYRSVWSVVRTRTLVLIDPPFERDDDYDQIVAATARVLTRNAGAVIAIWLPIKDLTTFDAFLTRLEDAVGARPALVVEVRLRPLTDPMKMNGCAMVVVNPPATLAPAFQNAAQWIADTLGEGGARAEIRPLGD